MTHKFAKIAITAVVLASAFGGLLWFSLKQDTAYYKHVDEVMQNPDEWKGKALQLHGFVVPGTWMQRPNTLEYQFKVENKGSVVHASYTGILPDTFKDEAEVVRRPGSQHEHLSHGFSRLFHSSVDVRRLRLRGGCVDCRRAARVEAPRRERYRRVSPRDRADDDGLGADHPRLRHQRLLD
jgi:cytochrome c-type biogenesis protein CcmE